MTENFKLDAGHVYRCIEPVPLTEIDRLASMSESTHNSGKSLEPGSIFCVEHLLYEGREAGIEILDGQVSGDHDGMSTDEFEINCRDYCRCEEVPAAEAIPLLERVARESDWTSKVRMALVALGTIGVTESVPLLEQSTRHPEDYIRAAAVVALGQVGDRRSLPALELLTNDPGRKAVWNYTAHKSVGELAAEAIEQINLRHPA